MIPILPKYFKGDSLESEFGFVNYYHCHPINRFLHTIAIPFLIIGLLTLFSSIDYRLAIIFSIFYCSIVCLFDKQIAIIFVVLFGILFLPSISIVDSQGFKAIFYGFGILLTGFSMQGIGHYQFQAGPPAFRPFEAVFTTPVFLVMYLISNQNDPFWIQVKYETEKWKKLLEK